MTIYMPLFRACTTPRALYQLHAHLLINGLHQDPLASTKLIESYARMSSLDSAKLVFEKYPRPDPFMYGVLIKCYVWDFAFGEAILLYNNMIYNGTHVNNYVYSSVLRACSGFCDLGMGKKIHGRVIKSGFSSDYVVETSLMKMYGEGGSLDDAWRMFDEMSERDIVSWSSIISSFVQNGKPSDGLRLFHEMVVEGYEVDSVVMLSAAEACGELSLVREAKSIHGYVLRKGIQSEGWLDNSLISMYGKCGEINSSEVLFDKIDNGSISSWTAMITCFYQNGCYEEALCAFIEMRNSNLEPNAVTMMGVLSSCARIGWVREGKSVHCYVIRKNIDADCNLLRPALIDLYANCGNVTYSQMIFDITQDKHTVLWNIIIAGYTREGMPKRALLLFQQMHSLGKSPDTYTLASVLSASGDLCLSELGDQVHCHIVKTGISNEFVKNSLIDMYSKCGLVKSAFIIFNDDENKSVVTWNSMVSGFSQNSKFLEAINLFDQMHLNCLEMNEVTFLIALQACSNMGYLEKGKRIHHKLIMLGFPNDMYVDTALTDMYAKCGDLHMARRVFNSMLDRTVVSWSAIIAGYGMHGDINTTVSLFDEMVELGIKPNEVTFMNILSACSHAGYVEKGKSYFSSMVNVFGINPTCEHFSCIVDLLSRAGDIDEAYRIIKTMPFPVDASIWGSLLNGCRIHRRMDLIKSILKTLSDVETDDTGYYTLISNVFAEGGEWDEFEMVRSMMRNMGLSKVHGYSAIEIDKGAQR